MPSIVELLAAPALGNLFILLAAFVGLGGSLYLYRRRREDLRSRLRLAFLVEMEETRKFTEALEELEDPAMVDPEYIPTTMYEENASELGTLSAEEVKALTRFYSMAIMLKEQIRRVKRGDYDDTHERKELLEMLANNIGTLNDIRRATIERVRGKSSFDYSPTSYEVED